MDATDGFFVFCVMGGFIMAMGGVRGLDATVIGGLAWVDLLTMWLISAPVFFIVWAFLVSEEKKK